MNQATTPQKTESVLRQNPFTTYRDPKTGQWVVVKPPEQPSKR